MAFLLEFLPEAFVVAEEVAVDILGESFAEAVGLDSAAAAAGSVEATAATASGAGAGAGGVEAAATAAATAAAAGAAGLAGQAAVGYTLIEGAADELESSPALLLAVAGAAYLWLSR